MAKNYGQVKGDFFNTGLNSGKSHNQVTKDWKRSDEKEFFDKGEHLSGQNIEPEVDHDDPNCYFAGTTDDV